MKNKENATLMGWVVGMLIGEGIGFAMRDITIGTGIGAALGIILSSSFQARVSVK